MKTFKTILAYFILIITGLLFTIVPSFFVGWWYTLTWVGTIIILMLLAWACKTIDE